MKTIFVVDDSDTNLSMAEAALEDQYRIMTMPSAAKMFSMLDKVTPDLILLDIEMPEMDGFSALQSLKSDASWGVIPVMFLTGRTDTEVEAKGFEMGAVDFVTKPFTAPVLINRIKTHLNIDEIIRERTAQLNRMQNSIVSVLADMVENRDKGTGGHIERTSTYIRILIEGMREKGVYANEMHRWDIENVVSSARMHDLGKITITDLILDKPGKLTPEEYEIMKTHTTHGKEIIQDLGDVDNSLYLKHCEDICIAHHERWDGKGYPNGLKGEEIPISARLASLADVYDALVSVRVYKPAVPYAEAVKIIMGGKGTQFDPVICDALEAVQDQFQSIAEKYI